MKRFLRSKLVLSLGATLMIAAAVVIPLSSSLTRTHAQTPATVKPSPSSTIAKQFPSNGSSHISVKLKNNTVSSTAGWQQTALTVQQGSQFTISYVSGTWTVDARSLPYSGPQGYTWEVDQPIYQGCKYDSMLTYATLLGEIGNGSDFAVGRGGVFTANSSGILSLRINDMDTCLSDNAGSIKLMASNGASGSNVNVDGTQTWTDTGIDLSKGNSVNIRASAIIWFASGNAVPYGPDGNPSCTMGSGSPAPGLHCYSLVANIANGTPFQLGSSASFTASVSGRLYLGVNDNVFDDNSGSWQANIIVHTTIKTGNYAGYAAIGTLNNTIVYSDVTATWIVPTVSCGFLETSQSANWAGLGDGSTDLEQVGTANTCDPLNGLQNKVVWQVYQNGLTQGPQVICTQCITGGDSVKAEVQFLSLGQFQFDFWDLSTNNHWSLVVSGDLSSKATALGECIEEVPQGQQLSDFVSVKINCQANPNHTYLLPIGSAGDIIQKYVMPQAKTGALYTSGTGQTFVVTWVHA